ncbi:MAG: hypothetical protein KDA24_20650 [Deltaproteobacteria bacterium]|nr:hypothetical protein [Deltaproteobacteria bacterium]
MSSSEPSSSPLPRWGLPREALFGVAALFFWAVGLYLRTLEAGSTSLDQAAIHPHYFAALMARGEPWPAVGPPAAFFVRHGTVNAFLLTLLQPFADSLLDSVRSAAVLRSLAIPLSYLLGRALGAPALGLAAAAMRALAPESVNLDRHFGGTYFLDPVLLATMWGLAAGRASSTARLAATGVGLACLPLVHPMGLPAALGLGGAWAWILSGRRGKQRLIPLGIAALPLLPYLAVEVASHFGAVRSVLSMLSGGVEFEAPGEEEVGLLWTVTLLLKDPAPLPLALPALLAWLSAPALAGLLLLRGDVRARLGLPLLGYAAGAGLLLLFFLAVQGGVGYGYGHHVMSAFLLGVGILCALWGRLAAARWGLESSRHRVELALGVSLVVALAPFGPRMFSDAEGADRSWPWGMSAAGSIEAMAHLIETERSGRPMHLALVHAPDAQPAPPVALSGVVVELLHRGLPLTDLPQHPPTDGPVEGWFILVGDGVELLAHGGPPGQLVPYEDPHPQAERMAVRVWRSEDFMVTKAWMESLPEGYELYGTEEYQDLEEYYFARPVWPGRGGALPIMESEFRSSDW